MSPNCVWLVIVGGCNKITIKDVGGVQDEMHTFIIDTNRLTMIVELGKIIIIIRNFLKFIDYIPL